MLVGCNTFLCPFTTIGKRDVTCHRITIRTLERHAGATGHRFDLADKLYIALGWGFGHGAAHAIFFYLSFLPLTTGSGTWWVAIWQVDELCAFGFSFLAGFSQQCQLCLKWPSQMPAQNAPKHAMLQIHDFG